jgi:hypothetical protein
LKSNGEKSNLNLEEPISEKVLNNQSSNSGTHVLIEIDGLWHEYSHDDDLFIANRLARKMQAELGWFEDITSHAPSVGGFYEALIENTIHEALPSNLSLETGFVYDSLKRDVSPQIDLIVYSTENKPPIYKRDNFAIIGSEDVVSCIEIKKTLTTSVLKNVIRKTIGVNMGTSPLAVTGVQFINIFAFFSKISLKKIEQTIADEVKNYLSNFKVSTFGGEVAFMSVMKLTLPRVYLFDRSGYVTTHCTYRNDEYCNISVSSCRSSAKDHSLGEFIVSATSQEHEEQMFNERNFLTFPLVQPISSTVIEKNVPVYTKITMQYIEKRFPLDIKEFKSVVNNRRIPYAALIPSGMKLENIHTLADLERTKGFQWLLAQENHLEQ